MSQITVDPIKSMDLYQDRKKGFKYWVETFKNIALWQHGDHEYSVYTQSQAVRQMHVSREGMSPAG
jgi:hypothetical protein